MDSLSRNGSLASFGGAGGQHACEIAEVSPAYNGVRVKLKSEPQSLGITRILIHKYSSILSAYGLNLAER